MDDITLSQVQNQAFEAVRQPLAQADTEGVGSHQTVTDGSGHYQIPRGKVIHDPIHGLMNLSAISKMVFDTPQFQRLRRLKQLGLSYYVYTGACHNRFEHSLGVAHLANIYGHQLNLTSGNLVENSDLRCVELAGLCHDLGHGPFSHVFEKGFLSSLGIKWEHENMSTDMLEYIVDDNNIDMSPDDLTKVKSMIVASHPTAHTPKENCWLFDIVANGRNGIDVDKFDYLLRDSRHCGVSTGFDRNAMEFIMRFSRVIDDEICYNYNRYMDLHELFHARARMHRTVYTHKKAKSVEFMVVDALLEANSALKISDKVFDVKEFVKLDDSLLDIIENWEILSHMLQPNPEDLHSLKCAQEIVQKLRRREIYKYVSEFQVPKDALACDQWQTPSSQDIVNCYHGSDVKLNAENVVIAETRIDLSMQDRNPLDHVGFYDDLYNLEKRHLKPDQISSMVPDNYQEKVLRVYSKVPDPMYVQAVHESFDAWQQMRFGHVHSTTPCKKIKPFTAACSKFKRQRLFN